MSDGELSPKEPIPVLVIDEVQGIQVLMRCKACGHGEFFRWIRQCGLATLYHCAACGKEVAS